MRQIAEFVAVLACGLFTGAAVYVGLVEHPARMKCGVEIAAAEFSPSYRRGSVMQAILAALGLLSSIAAWLAGARFLWAIAGILLGSVIPFTLIVMLPTIAELTQAIEREAEKCPGSRTAEDTSWSGCIDRIGVRSDPRERRTFPLWQAGGELSRSGPFRGIQRKPQAGGSHHEAGQFDVALSAGGSGAGHGAQCSGMAQPVLSPDASARKENRESGDGAQTGGSLVLHVAPGAGLRAVAEVSVRTRDSPEIAMVCKRT